VVAHLLKGTQSKRRLRSVLPLLQHILVPLTPLETCKGHVLQGDLCRAKTRVSGGYPQPGSWTGRVPHQEVLFLEILSIEAPAPAVSGPQPSFSPADERSEIKIGSMSQ